MSGIRLYAKKTGFLSSMWEVEVLETSYLSHVAPVGLEQ